MKISFNDLSKTLKSIQLDEKLDLSTNLKNRFPELILAVDEIIFTGTLYLEEEDAVLDAQIKCQVTSPSSRSLSPVVVSLNFKINEVYITDLTHLDNYNEEDVVIIVKNDIIDIGKAIEDNIVLQIPMHVVTDQENQGLMPEGNGWKVIDEESPKDQDQDKTDPRWDKLKSYFDNRDSD